MASKLDGNVLDPEREEVMDQGIEESIEDVREAEFESLESSDDLIDLSLGIETEYYIVDENNESISEHQRNLVIGKGVESSLESIDHELGASMVEIATDPIKNPENLDEVKKELERVENILKERVEEEGFKLVRHGANVSQEVNSIERTTEGKYIAVPNVYGQLRAEEDLEFSEDINAERMTDELGEIDSIDPRNEDLPAAICSTQLNMQADDMEDAIEKANTGYAVAPYITALSGNSRFIDGKDIEFNDIRMEVWEKAFDIGDMEKDDLDIGKIDEYFQDLEDIKERMQEQPRIVNDTRHEGIDEKYSEKMEKIPLNVAEGMFWKDARIKMTETIETEESIKQHVRDDLLVEFRQNSTQPTLEEDIAVHAFYIGRIIYEQSDELEGNSELLDIKKVNQNRYEAMRNGLNTELYDWKGEKKSAEEVIGEELEKAREGLEHAIGDSSYLDILDCRLENKVTPADEVAEQFYNQLLEEQGYETIEGIKHSEELPEDFNYHEVSEEVKKAAAVKATNQISMKTHNQGVRSH